MEQFLAWLYHNWLAIICVIFFITFFVKGGFKENKIKKASAGLSGFEIELEGRDQGIDCPHALCRDNVTQNTKKIWGDINSLETLLKKSEQQFVDMIKQISSDLSYVRKDISAISEKQDVLSRIQQDQGNDQLKLVFYNENMPEGDRCIAGLKYIATRAKNHRMVNDVIDFCMQHTDVYVTAISALPHLHIDSVDIAIEERKVK